MIVKTFSKLFQYTVVVLIVSTSFSLFLQAQTTNQIRTAKVTFDLKDVPLGDVLKKITEQTNFKFVYSDALKEVSSKVSAKATNEDLEAFLARFLPEKGISYKVEGMQIVLSPKSITGSTGGNSPQTGGKITVRGTVVDNKGETLPGAYIYVKGNRENGATSNASGAFVLNDVDPGAVLTISYIGFQTTEVAVGGKNEVRAVLTEDTFSIEAAVATGYQTISRAKVTGATATITSENLSIRFTPNIMNNLEGKVAGLVNYGGRIMIRGTGTLMAEARPLLIMDGLPIEGDFEDINPYDIESITILKDAAASAIYGARASNGVIVVATKKAATFNKIDIDVTSNIMVYQKPNTDYADNWYMTPAQQVDMEAEYYRWYFNDSPQAASNLTNTSNAIAGTGAYSLNISPIWYDHYQLKLGQITQEELNRRLAKYRTQNYAKEYAEHILQNRVFQQYNVAVRNRTENFQSNLVLNFKADNMGKITDNDKQFTVFYKGTYDMTKWMTINFSVNNIFQQGVERRSNYAESTLNWNQAPAYYSMFNPDGSYANISPGWTHYYNPYATWAEDNEALRPMPLLSFR